MTRSRDIGMQTFDQALFDLYEAGEITFKDAIKHADSPNDLRLRIKLEGKMRAKASMMKQMGCRLRWNDSYVAQI